MVGLINSDAKTLHSTSARYNLSLLALSPLAVAYVVYRSFKDGGWRYFKQRLGFGYVKIDSRPIHFHCASVGELITAKPLIQAIQIKYPDKRFVVTTNTSTAASLVNKFNHINITHYYLPIDLAFAVSRFLRKTHPLCTIILETEIWPTYYSAAAKKLVPIVIVNARLSKKSLETKNFVKNEYARALKNVSLVLARSKDDYEKFIVLGASIEKTHIIGNLKYAISNTDHNELACTTIKRPFFLAASTHEDEEAQLSEHLALLKRKNYLLIIAPRYPDRCKQLAQQFRNKGLMVSVRSESDAITATTDIYIVDTLGELNVFFNEAALVFVGGSLIPRGGHNVLEPASFGKCIIVGPNTDNFALETKDLLQEDAIIQVKDNYQLGKNLISLLKDDQQREHYGKNALQFMNKQSGVLNAYLKHLKPVLEIANS
jgi:3-deoxy-D-manno-octulosonic-acid transferase